MNRLDRRSKSNDNIVLEKRYMRMVLREEAEGMQKQQNRIMNRGGFKSRELFSNRKMDTTDTVLSYEHLKRHRFIDMKRRRTKEGSINKKNYPIHNRINYGFANNIVRRMSYGFTEGTREIMKGIDDK